MEFNWKVILSPEMQVKINDLLEKLAVEGMTANVEVSGHIVGAQIEHTTSGRNIIDIRIIPKGE